MTVWNLTFTWKICHANSGVSKFCSAEEGQSWYLSFEVTALILKKENIGQCRKSKGYEEVNTHGQQYIGRCLISLVEECKVAM